MEHSIAAPVFVGIDVAKRRLDVHVLPSGEAFDVPNDGNGVARLRARLADLAPALVVLEATGGYEVALVASLAAEALPVAVVTRARSATSPALRGAWQRRTGPTRRRSHCSRSASARSRGRCPTPRRRP